MVTGMTASNVTVIPVMEKDSYPFGATTSDHYRLSENFIKEPRIEDSWAIIYTWYDMLLRRDSCNYIFESRDY